jgi:MFS family permease
MLFRLIKINNSPGFDPKVLKHNILMNIGDGSMYTFGMSFIYAYTVIPIFIQQAGGNTVAIGAVPVLWTIGLNLPQLFFVKPHFTEKRVKPFVLRYALLNRLMYLIIGLFTFYVLNSLDPTVEVISLLLLYFLAAIIGSIAIPGWFHLFSKTTPVKLRGRLLAIRQLIGSILAVAAGSLTVIILSAFKFPYNFATLFFTAFTFIMISFYFLTKVIEDDEIYEEEKPINAVNKFVLIQNILKTNIPFRNFILADVLTTICLTATAFYPVFALKKFELSVSYAGTFTIITTASMIAGNLFFGYLADVSGHKINLLILAIASFMASLAASIANNILAYGIVFFFVGIALSLIGISRGAFVVELCSPKERQFYIAMLNSITSPFSIFGIAAGAVIGSLGYRLVFFIYIILAGIAVYWLSNKVTDPRVNEPK